MTAKLTSSIIILLFGVGCAVLYLRKPRANQQQLPGVIGGDRPWRRVGAAISLLVSVMFVLGIYVIDIPSRSQVKPYAAYWIVMLLLIVWLCALAIKDMLYTRKVVADWRAGRTELDGTPERTSRPGKENRNP